ncbi:MAG TPA: D-amino acid dehydrogenase [Burkholderiaceae bacterium]|nr:D-amino acid dehydrogenase [Burkholderiaceae bacterium]
MKIAVLGSGIIGTATAWWLSQAGHEVVVVDRQLQAGMETSRANGAQISVSYAEPWANPQVFGKLLKWLGRDDAPLSFKPQADLRQWLWGLMFLRECFPSRVSRNVSALVAMAEYSRRTLQEMRRDLGIAYDHQERGILNFYRSGAEFEQSQKLAEIMRDYGVDRRIVSADEVTTIEPALAPSRHAIVGGDYTPEDESGDAFLFTQELARRAAAAGVEFRYGTQLSRFIGVGGRVEAAELIDANGEYELLRADAYVAALGSHTPAYVTPLGVRCPVYPAKGYSATFDIVDADAAPFVSLTDSEHKVVYTRLGSRLRMAGTAELGGYSRALNTARCEQMSRLARELFPSALDFDNVRYWSGLRPATPSNVPLIGRTRISNLYLNTGHGTLGWTMGVGSGKALADLISGHRPEPEFPFLD